VRHSAKQIIFEEYTEVGYNYRMTDIQAAVGREQLKRLPEIITRRRELADCYHELLANIPGIHVPHEPEYARSNWQTYLIRLEDTLDQREVMQALLDLGISTRRGIMNAHREPAYEGEPWRCAGKHPQCDCANGTCAALSQSEAAQEHAIAIPLYVQMTDEEQDRVIDALRQVCTTML
jgi:dTDP-4-amino-4,6-dideoxygalactose transaminase